MVLFINFDGTSRLPGARFGGSAFKELTGVALNCQVIDGYLRTNEQVFHEIAEVAENENVRLAFGGDHSVSFPLIERQIRLNCKKVIVFDAHHDSYDFDSLTHFSFIGRLLSRYEVEVLIVGARYELDKAHPRLKFSKAVGVDPSMILRDIQDFVGGDDFYLSIDLDVIDPKEWDQVSSPVPEGLSLSSLSNLVERVIQMKSPQAIDLVEWNPLRGSTRMNALKPLIDVVLGWYRAAA